MARFDVSFLDGTRVVQRRVDVRDVQAIAVSLGVAAARLLSVVPADERPATTTSRRLLAPARFPLRLFSQELSVLLGAGIPLLEALTTLREKETAAHIHGPLSTLIASLEIGEPLSAALRHSPDAFDELFIAIVASSERTGQLREALASHAGYLAWTEDLRSKLVQASLYPAMLVTASVVVMVFLLVVVVPRFGAILDGVGGDIPAASRWLIALGGVAGKHPLLAVMAGLALLAAPVIAWRLPALRRGVEDVLWRLPAVGSRLRLLALTRLFRTMGMLVLAGVPVVASLAIARGVLAPRLRPRLDAATEAVSRGERLSNAFDQAGLSTPVSQRMLRVGEQSGELAAMLGQAATFYDEELTRFTELVTRLVNPLLMLAMGGLIGTIIVLLYMPIFALVEQVQ
jgi:general secretion pathway protein F